MEDYEAAAPHPRRRDRITRRTLRAENLETVLIVALAGLVFAKGAPVVAAIALGLGEMITAIMRW